MTKSLEIIKLLMYNSLKTLLKGSIKMKAIVTVTAKDTKGIIAKVTSKMFEYDANVLDISQSLVGEYFAMIMLIEMDEKEKKFLALSDALKELGEKENLKIQAMHEDIFNSMHRI